MLYFAYGSNMDPRQMARRCPGATSLGCARLADHALTFTWDSQKWRGGVGHIEPSAGAEVWGVLWDVSDRNLKRLDRYELVDKGVYARRPVKVDHDGEIVEALAYFATADGYTKPSRRYMSALIRGAQAHGLPGTYIERLRAVETRPYLPV